MTTPLRVRFGPFYLDEANVRLTLDQTPVTLAPKSFDVLCTLARSAGKLVTKDALLDAVWGHQHFSESVLKTVVSELREALQDDAKQPRLIETVPRRGYRFIGDIVDSSSLAESRSPSAINNPSPVMVGREAGLSQINAAWSRAAVGQRQIVWIAGEAGIGKTTLVDSFAATLLGSAHTIGQCVEQHGAGEPYLPVLEALGTLARNDSSLLPLLRECAPTWLLQLPWLCGEGERESLRQMLVNVGQERMLREFGELIERYCDQRPLVLITEDLHWSDHATVHLINHVARRRAPARLLWLATFRLAEVIASDHPLNALRHELRLHRHCEEIILEPLSETQIADYLDRRLQGRPITEAFVRALHDRTEGLPLFLTNIVDELATQTEIELTAQAANAHEANAWAIPKSLAGVIEMQFSRLPTEQQALLRAASVCGVEFRPDALAELLQQDVRAVIEVCDALARRGQWLMAAQVTRTPRGAWDARFEFRHALYRHVLHQGLGALVRAQWHGRAALALERLAGEGHAVTAAELAAHYELSQDLVSAVRHYADAAHNAMRHFAPAEALRLAERGLALLARCPTEAPLGMLALALEAMRGAASAQHLGVGSVAAMQAFERAGEYLEQYPRHPLRGLVLHALGIVYLVRAQYAQSLTLGEHIHAVAVQEDEPMLLLSACSVVGQAHALRGRHMASCEWLTKGVAAAESVSDEALRAAFVVDPIVTLNASLAIALAHVGRVDEARGYRDAATARAQRVGEPMAELVAHWFAALLAVRLGETSEVATRARHLVRLSETAALAQGQGPGRWFGAWARARLDDDPAACAADMLSAVAHNMQLGMLSGAAEVRCYAAEALTMAGQWQDAQTCLDQALASARAHEEWVYLTQMQILRARIAHHQGDAALAHQAANEAIDTAHAQQAPWLELHARASACELITPDTSDVQALADLLAALTQGVDTPLYRRAAELVHRHKLP